MLVQKFVLNASIDKNRSFIKNKYPYPNILIFDYDRNDLKLNFI